MLNTIDKETVLEIVSSALERMAFVAIEPAEESPPAPADLVLVRVRMWLPEPACVEMMASLGFGAVIAANAMALSPYEAITSAQAQDALAEFLNILASALLLPSNAITSSVEIVKGVPEIVGVPSAAEWDQFIAHDKTAMFSAEGCVVACRLTLENAE